MSLTLSDFEARFKVFAKFIYLHGLAATTSGAIRRGHMVLVDQHASGEASEFETHRDAVMPITNTVTKATTALSKMADQAKAGAAAYLKHIAINDFGLSATASITTVSTALVAAMVAVGANVSPGGLLEQFFSIQLGVGTLPIAEEPTLPDSYVSDAVV